MMRNLLQAIPECILKADAGLVTIDMDRVLDDRGFHGGNRGFHGGDNEKV
jgi:hypothetical protein